MLEGDITFFRALESKFDAYLAEIIAFTESYFTQVFHFFGIRDRTQGLCIDQHPQSFLKF